MIKKIVFVLVMGMVLALCSCKAEPLIMVKVIDFEPEWVENKDSSWIMKIYHPIWEINLNAY